MRKFDPWPVFFKREWKRNWPFLVGFAVTGALITKLSLGLTGKTTTSISLSLSDELNCVFPFYVIVIHRLLFFAEEEAKNSKFVKAHKR